MIDQLTDAECEITECVARRLNVVIEAVEALRRQIEQHIAAADGADPVEGKDVCPKCGGSGMIYCGWGEAEYCECRRDWKKEYEDAEEAIGGLVDERDELRAERDAAQARLTPFPATETCQECGSALGIGFHIADDVWAKISPTGDKWGALCPWCADKRLKALGLTDVPAVFYPAFDVLRDEPGEWERRARQAEERVRELEGHLSLDSGCLAEYEQAVVPALEARIKALEADAALGALVRRAVETHRTVEIARSQTGYHDVLLNDHIDVHGKRHAIHGGGRKLDDALRAALGEEATDAH